MSHPDLTSGLCCICFGGLDPETIYVDSDGTAWNHHRGKCAALAGIVPTEHQDEQDRLIGYMHLQSPGSEEHAQAVRDYYKFVDEVSKEDFYNMEGPE